MTIAIALLLLPLLSFGVLGFNLEPRYSEIIVDPTGNLKSYFGYALGFWRQESGEGNRKWLLVGAPRSKDERLKGEGVREPGAVYKCLYLPNETNCSMVPLLNDREYVNYQDLAFRYGKTNKKPAQAWIGGTIAVENKPNGAIVVCGARMKFMKNHFTQIIPGTCYYWQNESEVTELPSMFSKSMSYPNAFEYSFTQVGLSAVFLKDVNYTQLVVSAPGFSFFGGGMGVFEKDPKNSSTKGLPYFNVPVFEGVHHYEYIGYSVATARFHSNGSVSYITGAPRATGSDPFTGVVHVVQQPHAKAWNLVTTLKGNQLGEYFGATLEVVDIDLDGLDDLLLVGAPLHSSPGPGDKYPAGDHGVVYMYINYGEGKLDLLEEKLSGSSFPGARFGSSIAAVGDINHDGYTDVVVGAPYEGSGVVYLYHGQHRGIRSHYSQRIPASDINSNLKGFGISILGGFDIDDNGFNDIAVGSYESSSVVIIKSYPVINITATVDPSVNIIDNNTSSFSVTGCIHYNSRADNTSNHSIRAEMKFEVDPEMKRAALQNHEDLSEKTTLTQNVKINPNNPSCWTVNITLKDLQVIGTQPIDIYLHYKGLNDPSMNHGNVFHKHLPVVDPLSPSSVKINVPIAKSQEVNKN